MTLLLILRKIWRYRLVTVPVMALTFIGAIYVVAVKSPEYKVSASYVLINPPPPPTADEIARNPALARLNPNNPYTRFSDQSVIVSLLSSSLSADAARQQLVSKGADPRYTVSPDLQLGYSSLVIQVEGVGSTPEAAVHTAQLVGAALGDQLERVQATQGVDPHYRIKTQQVVAPNSPTQQLSSTLRPLVGVLAIGAILLLLAVSGGDALDTIRSEWRTRNRSEGGGERHGVEGGTANNGGHDAHDRAAEAAVPNGSNGAKARTKRPAARNGSNGAKAKRNKSAGNKRRGSRARSGA